MTAKDLIKEAAKMYICYSLNLNSNRLFYSIYVVHDEIKDKAFELEMSWIGADTNGKHEWVPKELFDEAERLAQEAIKPESDSDIEQE